MANLESGKRKGGGKDDDDESPTKNMRISFEQMWDSQKLKLVADIVSAVEPNIKEVISAHAAQVDTRISKLEGKHERYAEANDGVVADLKARVESLEKERIAAEAKHQHAWEKLDTSIAAASKAATATANATANASKRNAFDRELDHTIFKINAEAPVSKVAVLDSIKSWIAEGAIAENEFEVQGRDLGKYFNVQLLGDSAELRVNKLRELLRNDEGVWKRFNCKDPVGKTVELFVGLDKKRENYANRISHQKTIQSF